MLKIASSTVISALDNRLLLLLAMTILAYIFSFRRLADRLNSVRASVGFSTALLALLAAPVILALVTTAAPLPLWLMVASWPLSGFGAGFILICWGTVWADYYRVTNGAKVFSSLFSTVVISTALSFSMIYLPSIISFSVLLLMSIICVFCLTLTQRSTIVVSASTYNSVREYGLPFRAITHVAVLSLYLGYCSAKTIAIFPNGMVITLLLPAFLIAGIFIIVAKLLRKVLTVTAISRIVFPVSIAGSLMIFLPDERWATAIQFLFAVVGCCSFMLYHWSFVNHWSARYEILPLAQAAFGVVAPLSGTFAGWGLYCLLATVGLQSVTIDRILVVFLLFAYIVVSAIMPYGSEIHIVDAERPVNDHLNDETGIWKASLRHIAETTGLTRREREVFAYLARGRNINYISTKLVISDHTVKTHVYRIYSKLEINSQQELISQVENCADEFKEISRKTIRTD
jgi:DNA-binding CsgD family transcriptional regulator